jgi:hypothetical protein
MLVAVLGVVFLAWMVWGYVAVRGIEQPAYAVLEQNVGYEVREYPAYLMAQVSMKGSWTSALTGGSDMLAEYIRGDNIDQKSIVNSAPVGIESELAGERIAMTAPMLAEEKNGAFLVSLIMPASYTSATLPRPNNPEIRIVEQPSAVVAVREFGGRADVSRAEAEESALRELLARDKRVTVSASRVAQYNPPWIPPFMLRNEVMIAVRRQH